MRRQAPADWEDLWLSGEDATWMCVDCWRSHLESIGASTAPTDLARHLGLPLFAVTTSRCPAEIADDRLLPGRRSDGTPRVFHCDHCRAVLREGPEGCGGTFIHDRVGRHLWSYDSVRPVLAASGACLGLRRPSGRDWQPPPRVPDPAFPDAPRRVAAWEGGLWDATWMCFDCAAGYYGHQPAWLKEATSEDFTPSLTMEPLWVCPTEKATKAPTARGGRKGGHKGRGGKGRR